MDAPPAPPSPKEPTNIENDLEWLISDWDKELDDLSVDVDHINHFYGEGETRKQVLFDNRLKIRRGEIVIMTGPSGSGKTTLLTLIGTLRAVQEGSLKVVGTELKGITPEATNMLRKRIGFIFQAHNLFESLTAFQNVQMATELVGIPFEEAKPRIEQALTRLHLGERIQYKPKSLSGGQKQRVAVARGIIHRPDVILADEPTAALDAVSGREVVTIFQELARDQKCTILIVTHDNRILDVADRIVSMVDGNITSNVLVRRNSTLCRVLQSFPIFHSFTPQTLSQIAEKVNLTRYEAGAEIIRQGDIGGEFFVIGRGDVDVDVDGVFKRSLGRGAFFGELSSLNQQRRSATIRARTDVVCFTLNEVDFRKTIDSNASFEQELRKAIFSRL